MTALLKLKNIFSLFSLFALALASFFTVCHLFSTMPDMNIGSHTNSHTIFRANSGCCQTNDHHSMLQSISDNAAIKNFLIEKIGLIFIPSLFFYVWFFHRNKIIFVFFHYLWRTLSRIRNYLVVALSGGILQPQIYNA